MTERAVMEVLVELRQEEISTLKGEDGEVILLPFGGRVRGELFEGVVAPGGVDVQESLPKGGRSLCARYMLVGKSASGESCQIYVCNQGVVLPGQENAPFTTTPRFLTDNRALSEYFRSHSFRGEGAAGEEGLVIRIIETGERTASGREGEM